MNKLYSMLLLVLCGLVLPAGAQVLEDFEGATRNLTFGGDGVFSVVKNPDSTNTVNRSTNVGQYVKDSTKAFSLLIADLPSATTLTAVNNQLFVDIRATQDTRVLAKLEGTGVAVEVTLNIPVADQWRRYRFDLSKAAVGSSFTKIIFFFDAGNEKGKATYFFDNITLGSDPCAGTVRDLSIVDDFECQRQLPLRQGGDSLTIVENPAPDDVNGAGKVGKYVDPPGRFSALVYNFDGGIDLTTKTTLKLKYWSSKANRLVAKIEGGTDGFIELPFEITEANARKWVEVSFDFAAAAGKNYKSLTFFTDFLNSDPGTVYYFDDIRFEEKQIDYLEDFDADLTLVVRPLDNNAALNGTIRVIDNPDKSGLNETPKVAEHKKGSAGFSSIQLLSAAELDLSVKTQVNMLIWAPAGSQTVRLSALSTSNGRKDVTRDITATEEWIEVSFNFPDLATAKDVNEFQLIFDGAIIEPGRTYYFDQIYLSAGSVDPCEGSVPVANLFDDFECQRNVAVVNGAADIRVIDNPDKTAPNASDKVGAYTRPAGAGSEFANVSYEFDALDLSVFNRVRFDLWAPAVVPVTVKFEDSANGTANKEVAVTVESAMAWHTYTVDFSDVPDGQYQRLVFFFNFNTTPATEQVYYVDNIRLVRGPVSGCVFDFESANSTPTDINRFAGGAVNDTAYAVIPNPDKRGINTSDKVGRFTEGPDGLAFAGLAFPFGAPIIFPAGDEVIRLKVWAPDTVIFVGKLERPGGEAGPGTGDIKAAYTTPGQWQEISYDISGFDYATAGWQTFTLIPNFYEGGDAAVIPTAVTQYYFDEIKFGTGTCRTVSGTREERRAITDLKAYPNPTSGQLFVEAPATTERLQLFDALGRQVANVAVYVGADGGLTELNVDGQAAGFYTVVALDRGGVALARVRVAVTD